MEKKISELQEDKQRHLESIEKTGFDLNGYDREGYNKVGRNKDGIYKNKKLGVPYNKVAKQALMNWNGLSEEETEKIILESTRDEVESQVYAKSSMESAISEMAEIADIENGKEILSKIAFEGYDYTFDGYIVQNEKETLQEFKNVLDIDIQDKTIDILSAVHDGWVKDNSKKFFAREKKHQHMPIELIGWKEAKADLLFVRPILEEVGIEISEEELEQAYNQRVGKFILDNDIKSNDDLANLISKGAEFYPALEGQEDIIKALSDTNFVKDTVMPQIEENGIGNIERISKEIELENLQKEDKEESELLEKAERLDKLQKDKDGKTVIDE